MIGSKSPLQEKYEGCDFFADKEYCPVGKEIILCGNKGVKLSDEVAVIEGVRYTYDPQRETLTRTEGRP
jgi:hypothetical protein